MKRIGIVFILLAAVAVAQDSQPNPRDHVMARLTAMEIDVDFDEISLADAIDELRERTNLNFVFSRHVEDPKEMIVNLKLKRVRVISVLRVLTGQHDLAAVLNTDGMIVITSKDEVNRKVVTRGYDVTDLMFRIRDFPGPRIGLEPTQEPGAAPDVVFVMDAPSRPRMSEESLAELIRSMTGGDSWHDNERTTIRKIGKGLLIVTQSKAVHRQIERLFSLLRGMY
jgi:hypothetical protein